ncbi:MAG: M3 family oligoendopeptidase [Chloroflexi bacterium]|nr:M3 family oligoendopeptidase [Chloroflexota bacterium]
MATAAPSLPRWDMNVVYPSLASPEFAHDFQRLGQEVAALEAFCDASGIGLSPRHYQSADAGTARTAEETIERFNVLLEKANTIDAYLYAFVATDSRDAMAQARRSEYEQLEARLSQLGTRFTAWIGSLDVEALLQASAVAREYAYPLRRAHARAEHLMSPAEEALASDLSLSGGVAWQKLWGNVSSQIAVPVQRDGQTVSPRQYQSADAGTVELPMSAVRNLAHETDRQLRRRAYEAELAAWRRHEVPLAAAMNGIKGEYQTLAARRHWATPLDASLFQNGIDRPVLETMLGVAREYFPIFRRYLRAKARALSPRPKQSKDAGALGLERLAWYDLFAPVGASSSNWDFPSARDFILEQFGSFSERMRGLGARAFAELWIDAEPREGKRDGAFCMHLRGGESRILANYQTTLSGVTTLAHELGHAYHNLDLADHQPLQRATPMILAETASTFSETMVRLAALRHAAREEQILILNDQLQDATQVVLDITSRFLFEQGVFAKRAERELSPGELSELMLQAQRDTYGDGLDEMALHPYMWAVKPHYYSADVQFYNYPYMFGLLFGLGLYARYLAEPEAFKAGYDELLSATGLAEAATLAGRFGIDVRSADFWSSSLEVIRADVDRFEALVG